MEGLSELASKQNVENVLIYIADSLRLDYLPDRIANRGVTLPTVAASTYTASSIPSMMTGQYPATHRVWGFNDVVDQQPSLLSGPNRGMDLRNVWDDIDDPAQKPPNRVLRLEEQHTLEEASNGFTIAIHEKGAHAPYDYFNVDYDSSPPYFEDYAGKTQELREQYRRGAESAADRFLDTIESLEARRLLEDTLVLFTSDHGELLGEKKRGGIYAHGSPVCPELVRVPTVFLGAGLPEGKKLNWVTSGIDLAPTALSAQGRDIPTDIDGVDLWRSSPSDDRAVRSDFWARGGRIEYAASSGWDKKGGYVKQFGSRTERIAFAIHRKLIKGIQAPANRKHQPEAFLTLLKAFGREEHSYGTPGANCKRCIVSEFLPGTGRSPVEEVDEEQLRALGYVD